METKLYRSRLALVQDLASRFEEIDGNASMRMVAMGFVTKDGVQHQCLNPLAFCNKMEELFSGSIDPKGTRMAGKGAYLVTFLDVQTKEQEVKEVKSFDKEYAMSLQDGVSKKDAKIALEEYARELGIELNRSKTFDNMIEDALAN